MKRACTCKLTKSLNFSKSARNDNMQENLMTMNNLLRMELLGQQAPETLNENRVDGQVSN